jgi:hypothetical protein
MCFVQGTHPKVWNVKPTHSTLYHHYLCHKCTFAFVLPTLWASNEAFGLLCKGRHDYGRVFLHKPIRQNTSMWTDRRTDTMSPIFVVLAHFLAKKLRYISVNWPRLPEVVLSRRWTCSFPYPYSTALLLWAFWKNCELFAVLIGNHLNYLVRVLGHFKGKPAERRVSLPTQNVALLDSEHKMCHWAAFEFNTGC